MYEYHYEYIKKKYGDKSLLFSPIPIRFLMASLLLTSLLFKQTAKGIVKSTIKKELTHERYKYILENANTMNSKMKVLKSEGHKLFTMKINKISLSAYDDKRYIRENGINSYAYGHYKTRS